MIPIFSLAALHMSYFTTMEEDIEILNIYNKIKKDKLQYCKICLKNERETKLVTSHGLESLFNGLKNEKFEFSPRSLICYMCDARARTAATFISALEFACEVKVLFTSMNGNSGLQDQFRGCYFGSKRPRGRSLVKTFLRCEKQLQAVQRTNELAQSQVLIVGSDTSTQKRNNRNTAEKKKPKPGGEKTEIVISDDEEDAVVYVPQITPKPIEKLLNKHPAPQLLTSGATFPTADEQTQKMNAAQMEKSKDNNTNSFPTNSGDIPLIVSQNTNTATVIHPIYQDASGTLLIPTLGGQIDKEGNFRPMQKVTVEAFNFQPGRRNPCVTDRSNLLLELDGGSGNGLDGTSQAEEGFLSKEATPRIQSVISENPFAGGGSKARSTHSSGVDWEDKIPMDVISLMDNPKPNTVIQAPGKNATRKKNICAIENVRSVR